MAGKSTSESLDNVMERLWPVLKANWVLWPAAQVSTLFHIRSVEVAHALS